jgi:hypothetical protein
MLVLFRPTPVAKLRLRLGIPSEQEFRDRCQCREEPARIFASRRFRPPGLPCGNPPMCDLPYTVQDKLWCERAVKMGYDSIQVARPHHHCKNCVATAPGYYSSQELTLCTGECMSKEQAESCPSGVELRTASGKPCNCSNVSHSLNCGKGSMLYGRPDDGKQTCITDSPHYQSFTSPELGEIYAQNLDGANFVLDQTRALRLSAT